MTDTAQSAPAPREAGFFRTTFDFFRSDSIVARVIVLAALLLALEVPLSLVDGVIADRLGRGGRDLGWIGTIRNRS